ncbi:MAG: hypothetical protein C4542_04815 [Dehalococcoidia bacterium]|nr:MAG: hypothetical protein C4542_04815 [Dehalococcoidia bacterium]
MTVAGIKPSSLQNHTIRLLRRQAFRYIESCYLNDGGYCFARVPPASGLDTYFALSGLSLIGRQPKNRDSTVQFLYDQLIQDSYNLPGIWMTIEAMREAGCLTGEARNYGLKVMGFQNEEGGFGSIENLYIEVTSELEATYHALLVLQAIGAEMNRLHLARFVAGFANTDGSYGRALSPLATTYYATAIYRLLGIAPENRHLTAAYLRAQEADCQKRLAAGNSIFMEQTFWLIKALSNLDIKASTASAWDAFVRACQRPGGGFARTARIGIPTLEYTFYALSILKETGVVD